MESGAPCHAGEVDFWLLPEPFDGGDAHHAWWPADGRRIDVPSADGGSGYGHLPETTPNVPAPEGMQSLVCLWENPGPYPRPWLGQANLFAFVLSPFWMPARGQRLSVGPGGEWSGMYELLTGSDANPGATFDLPNLTGPGPGVGYYIATDGAWPLASGY